MQESSADKVPTTCSYMFNLALTTRESQKLAGAKLGESGRQGEVNTLTVELSLSLLSVIVITGGTSGGARQGTHAGDNSNKIATS